MGNQSVERSYQGGLARSGAAADQQVLAFGHNEIDLFEHKCCRSGGVGIGDLAQCDEITIAGRSDVS